MIHLYMREREREREREKENGSRHNREELTFPLGELGGEPERLLVGLDDLRRLKMNAILKLYRKFAIRKVVSALNLYAEVVAVSAHTE